MQHSGAISGSTSGSAIIVAAAHRGARAEAAIAAGAGKRTGRDDATAFIRATDKPEDAVAVVSKRQGFEHERRGAPTSAYMAQHIAQEVTPEDPGFDRHQAGTRAYILQRDSRFEFFAGTGGIDITV